ncbi:MAG: hypothetical protein K6V73_04690 [Firmicutes bacterium]|nr:hypothetical protein [Bacillota bacterium]
MTSASPPLSDVIRIATQTLVEHLTPLATAAAVVVFPMTLWEGALPPPSLPTTPTPTAADLARAARALSPWVLPAAVDAVASFLMGAAVVWMLAEAMAGRATGPWEGYRAVFGRLGKLVSAGLAQLLALAVVAVVLVLPGALLGAGALLPVVVPLLLALSLVLSVYFALVTQVVMREDLGFVAALRRSARLVSGAFWPTLALMLIGAVVTALFGTLSGLPAAGGVTFVTRALSELIAAAVSVTAGLYPAALLTALYRARAAERPLHAA